MFDTVTAPPPPPSPPHILCTDLVRIFSAEGVEVQALQGLNLRVDPGEMVAVVGASGSGKSTLLTILSGLDTATAGVARVAGHDLLTMGSRERVAYQRRTVGFVWQQTSRNLLPYLTAGDAQPAIAYDPWLITAVLAGSVLVSVAAAWAAARIGSRVNAARAMRKEEEG